MSAVTLADQAEVMRAAALMTTTFGHLPGAHIEVDRSYPGKIAVSLHDGFGDFEAWRVALGIPVTAVRFNNGASSAYLSALGAFSGATVELVGYSSALPGERP